MKKKIYLAMMAAVLTLSMSACGGEAVKQKEGTESVDSGDTEEAEAADKSGTRLVTVKNTEDYIKLAEYKGITLEKTVEEILDEAVDAEVEERLADPSNGYFEKVTDGQVQDGDMTKISYIGKKDGEAFEGGSADEYDLHIGSGSFIPGFEDGMIGMTTGETRSIDLTFPEEYPSEDLAGQPVVFDVTVQEISRAPEFSAEWVTSSTEFASVEDYKASVKAEMQEEANLSAEEALKNQAFTNVYSATEVIEYPEEDLQETMDEYERQMESYAQAMGVELDAFLESQGYTREQFDQEKQTYSEMKLKQNLVIQAIMDAEGITLEDEESLAIQDQMIQDTGAESLAQVIDMWGQQVVDESIALLRVENWIVENANVQEMVAAGDTVALSGDGNEALTEGEDGVEAPEGEVDEALEEAEIIDPETETEETQTAAGETEAEQSEAEPTEQAEAEPTEAAAE